MILDKIQWGIPCGPDSDKIITLLIKSVYKTARHPERFEFVLGVTSFVSKEKLQKRLIKYEKNIVYIEGSITELEGSASAGDTINKLHNYMTSELIILSDCDVVLLKKNWDELLITQIKGNIATIGVTTDVPDELKAIIGDGRSLIRYKNFPNNIFCIINNTIAKRLDICWKSLMSDDNSVIIEKVNISNKHLYPDLSYDDSVSLDTGYMFHKKLIENGYTGICLHLNNSEAKIIDSIFFHEFLLNDEVYLIHIKKHRIFSTVNTIFTNSTVNTIFTKHYKKNMNKIKHFIKNC